MGYTGGTTANPTYHSLGNHTESVQLDYDPSVITYEELLTYFWGAHDSSEFPTSQQYMSAVFPMNKDQEATVEKVKSELEKQAGYTFQTAVIPLEKFYLAEEYHQKYYMQARAHFLAYYQTFYPDAQGWINSTAATRVNAYWAGYGSKSQLMEEKAQLGLPDDLFLELEDHVNRLSDD